LQDKNINTLMYAGVSLVIVIFVNLSQEGIYQFHVKVFFISCWKDLPLVEVVLNRKREKWKIL